MSCSQTLSGLAKDCTASMGGIKRVLLANQSDVTAISITTNVVSTITMDTGKKFKEYNFRAGTGSMSSNWQINAENGVAYVQTDLVMIFNRLQTAARVEVMAMAAADLYAIVEDQNSKYWILGLHEAVNLSAGDGLTGTARTDRSGYSVTLTENSPELPTEVDSSIIAGLL